MSLRDSHRFLLHVGVLRTTLLLRRLSTVDWVVAPKVVLELKVVDVKVELAGTKQGTLLSTRDVNFAKDASFKKTSA